MAATRSRPASRNGSHADNVVATKAKEAGDAVVSAARSVPSPLIAGGAAMAGLAGGLMLGSRSRKSATVSTVQTLARGARQIGAAAGKAANTADDIRALREQLEALNRRSPIEIVLDGLTHRRGAHRLES